MRERIALFIILAGLTAFIYVFQYHVNTLFGYVLLLAFMTVYGIYSTLAFKHKKRKLKEQPLKINEDYKPFVSIMIPAHNEEAVIAHTVENIMQLSYSNFEIIVIDDRSTDNTASVIKNLELKYKDKVKTLIREQEAFPGKSAVLNDALALAKGEAILVFDADATVEPDFLSICVWYLVKPDKAPLCQSFASNILGQEILSQANLFCTKLSNNIYRSYFDLYGEFFSLIVQTTHYSKLK